jgi:AcrR family transcriptional regulator
MKTAKVEKTPVRSIRTLSDNHELVAERRKHTVQMATKVFLKKGYDRTNMLELAKAFNMSTGYFYRYFASKDDIRYMILKYAVDDLGKNLRNKLAEDTDKMAPVPALVEAINTFFAGVDDLQDMYNFNNHVLVELPQEERKIAYDSEIATIELFETLLRRGMESGDFTVSDPRLMAHNIVMAGNAWANRRWYLKRFYTLKQYTEEQTRLVLDAVHAKIPE